jgi:hypothetical protein
VTKTLRRHLRLEGSKWRGRVAACQRDIDGAQEGIDGAGARQAASGLALDRLSLATQYFLRGLQRARGRGVVAEADAALRGQDQAEGQAEGAAAAQGHGDGDAERAGAGMGEEQGAGQGQGPARLAAAARRKPMDARSKEDRRFIGMDLLLHPEEYASLGVAEGEEMQCDPDYQCALRREDLERIRKLPEPVSLAMPFLVSEAELAAHRLVNAYYRDKDDEYFRKKDFLSYGAGGGAGGGGEAGAVTASDMAHADR